MAGEGTEPWASQPPPLEGPQVPFTRPEGVACPCLHGWPSDPPSGLVRVRWKWPLPRPPRCWLSPQLRQLCRALSLVSDHHHNLLAVVQFFPDVTSRSRWVRLLASSL